MVELSDDHELKRNQPIRVGKIFDDIVIAKRDWLDQKDV